MANYRKWNGREIKLEAMPDSNETQEVSNIVEHRGNPLTRRIPTLRLRVEYTMLKKDLLHKLNDPNEFGTTPPERTDLDLTERQYVIICSAKGTLDRFFKIKDVWPELEDYLQRVLHEIKAIEDQVIEIRKYGFKVGDYQKKTDEDGHPYYEHIIREAAPEEIKRRIDSLKREKSLIQTTRGKTLRNYTNRIKNARHEVRVCLPQDRQLPPVIPGKITAQLKVNCVEWDRGAELPTLIIHSDLLSSAELGINADGALVKKPEKSPEE